MGGAPRLGARRRLRAHVAAHLCITAIGTGYPLAVTESEPDLNADFVEQVRESATRLLDTIHHDELPDGGIYDVDIADDTGLELATVRVSLAGLADDTLDVRMTAEDQPWVVSGLRGATSTS